MRAEWKECRSQGGSAIEEHSSLVCSEMWRDLASDERRRFASLRLPGLPQPATATQVLKFAMRTALQSQIQTDTVQNIARKCSKAMQLINGSHGSLLASLSPSQ